MNEMYKKINDLCYMKGVNITQMCREAEVTRGALTDLKMGRSETLATKNLSKLAAYFGVPMDHFLPGDTLSAANLRDSVVVQGNSGNNTITNGRQSGGPVLTEQEQELLRIFRSLDVRKKTAFLSYGYELEDGK